MEDKTQNEIIKEVCERWGVSQIRLAEKLGVSIGAVRQWSSGVRKLPKWFDKSVEFVDEIHKLNAELKEKYNNKNTQ